MEGFINRKRELPAICASCKYIKMCGGGCPRMEGSMYVGDDKGFCGYKAFLDGNGKGIEEVIRLLQ
jgi:radical SAM protein with 4Fe4S-binding SPASM domain